MKLNLLKAAGVAALLLISSSLSAQNTEGASIQSKGETPTFWNGIMVNNGIRAQYGGIWLNVDSKDGTDRLEIGQNGNVISSTNDEGMYLHNTDLLRFAVGEKFWATRMEIRSNKIDVFIPLYVSSTLQAKEIQTTEVNVQVGYDGGADFVFEEDYKLRPLEEVAAFVKENKHLPEIAPAADMRKDGVNMSDFQIQLLQKVEELTLYMIDLKKENVELRKEVEELKEK